MQFRCPIGNRYIVAGHWVFHTGGVTAWVVAVVDRLMPSGVIIPHGVATGIQIPVVVKQSTRVRHEGIRAQRAPGGTGPGRGHWFGKLTNRSGRCST